MNDVERSVMADREQPAPPQPATRPALDANESADVEPEQDEEPVPDATYEPL